MFQAHVILIALIACPLSLWVTLSRTRSSMSFSSLCLLEIIIVLSMTRTLPTTYSHKLPLPESHSMMFLDLFFFFIDFCSTPSVFSFSFLSRLSFVTSQPLLALFVPFLHFLLCVPSILFHSYLSPLFFFSYSLSFFS